MKNYHLWFIVALLLLSIIYFSCEDRYVLLTLDQWPQSDDGIYPQSYPPPSPAAQDVTPPALNPGIGGTITTAKEDDSSVKLIWAGATDDITPVEELEYLILRSQADLLTDWTTVNANMGQITTVIPWTIMPSKQYIAGGLTIGVRYYFNILVRDNAGNMTFYTSTSYIPTN